MSLKPVVFGGLAIGAALLFGGCSPETANTKESKATEAQQKIYVDGQPAPFFDWSLERHLLTQLYKARNEAVNTKTIVRDINGKIFFECDSIGFPIASNTQLTAPESYQKVVYNEGAGYERMILPQAEPNGLYSSPSSAGTFVFCLNEDGSVSPSYFEADIETHADNLKITTKK